MDFSTVPSSRVWGAQWYKQVFSATEFVPPAAPNFLGLEKINQLMSEAIMLSIDAKLAEAHEKSMRPQPNFLNAAYGYSMQGARRGRSGGCGGSG